MGFCSGGKCKPDNRCESNDDCGGPDSDTKCKGGFCDERTEDPYEDQWSDSISIGCESCTMFCEPTTFLCEKIPCTTRTDCPGVIAPEEPQRSQQSVPHSQCRAAAPRPHPRRFR